MRHDEKRTRPPTRLWTCALAAACCWLLSSGARADVIHLKNGNQIQGEIVQRTPRSVKIRFPGGFLEVSTRDVLRIESESRLDYLLAEGEKHAGRRDFDGALDFLNSALSEYPDSARVERSITETRVRHAEHLRETRRLAAAEAAYGEVLRLRPGDDASRTRLTEIRREIATVRSEQARGIRELASGATASGYSRLKRLYEQYPDRRDELAPHLGRALIEFAHMEIERQNLDKAERYYRDALTLDPDLLAEVADGYVFVKANQLRPLFELNEYERLRSEVDRALEVVPSSALLNYFRGHALEGLGQWKEAAETYLSITGGSRPRDLKRSLPLLKRNVETTILGEDATAAAEAAAIEEVLPGGWRTIRTEHFLVRHRNNKVGRDVAQVAEATYRRLFDELGLKTHWYKPCEIRVYPTKEDFMKLTGKHSWMGGAHEIASNDGALSQHRIDTFQTQPRLSQVLIPHEVAHAVLAHRLRYRATVPLWINEGFSMWVEPSFVHQYNDRLVRHAAKLGSLTPVSELVRVSAYPDEADVRLFYAQCFSLATLLIRKGGLERFLDFAEELSLSPESLNVLLKRHFDLAGVPALESYWHGTFGG